MRFMGALVLFAAMTGQAVAQQAPLPESREVIPHRVAHAHSRHTLKQRFDAANTTQDGHLTAEQAKSGHMRFEAAHFSEIDTTNQSYITFDQDQAFRRARRASRKSAQN